MSNSRKAHQYIFFFSVQLKAYPEGSALRCPIAAAFILDVVLVYIQKFVADILQSQCCLSESKRKCISKLVHLSF